MTAPTELGTRIDENDGREGECRISILRGQMTATEGSRKQRVLIVDDEKLIGVTLAHVFGGRGYDARAVESAEEALELVDTWVPDLAVLDVNLPKMDGVELAIRIKAMFPECRTVLISGAPESEIVVQRYGPAGQGLELLAKPIHPEDLLARAAQLLA
jgi:CheY-like chemotaxis protein